ncbi:RagB/SusD family nutrient uptake outer membrane protein [Chitinophaga barathri]|nr:RagB/SusD family nutrient uptake outer membrane protein [Chitinophaga barathri]
MRKQLTYILAICMFCACDKKLDILPTQEPEADYFKDEDHLQRGIGGAYAKLTDLYAYNANSPRHRLWLLPGDDLMSNNPTVMDNFSGLNGGDGDLNNVWKTLYEIVNRTNTMLEITEQNKQVYMTAGLADFNKGEMLFLRGWAFYKLWTWWKKAPVSVVRIKDNSGDLYLKPSKDLELLDQAIKDWKDAATLLPDSWPAAQTGRVTKNSAYGMLVKGYVTRACFNSKNLQDYGDALAAYQNIKGRALVAHFGDNFDYRKENNSESLFEFQASASSQENPWLMNDFGKGTGSMGAFYQYFEDSWTNLGTLMGPSLKLIQSFGPVDPRRGETIAANPADPWSFNGGYKFTKYINGERGKYVGLASINSINNTRILRLADIKLLVAEAYLQTGKPAEALAEINDVRARARKSVAGPEAAQPAALAAVTMADIMNERLLELAGEDGIRWNDLQRWHAAGYINLGNWTKADFGFPVSYANFSFTAGTHVLMPIPVSEMETNPNMLSDGQNPGY